MTASFADLAVPTTKQVAVNDIGSAEDFMAAIDETISTVQRESAPDASSESWQALSTASLRDTSSGPESA